MLYERTTGATNLSSGAPSLLSVALRAPDDRPAVPGDDVGVAAVVHRQVEEAVEQGVVSRGKVVLAEE